MPYSSLGGTVAGSVASVGRHHSQTRAKSLDNPQQSLSAGEEGGGEDGGVEVDQEVEESGVGGLQVDD